MTAGDDLLQQRLAAALAMSDPVPPQMVAIAKGLFAWREIDGLIADLTFDSAIDELAGVRGTAVARSLVFRHGELAIEVVVTLLAERVGERDLHRLVCHLEPVVPGRRVVVRHVDGEVEGRVSAYGEVEFTDVPAGPVQLSAHGPDGVVTTPAVAV